MLSDFAIFIGHSHFVLVPLMQILIGKTNRTREACWKRSLSCRCQLQEKGKRLDSGYEQMAGSDRHESRQK